MEMKNLYILINDGGDGSYYPLYTFNDALIGKIQEAYDLDLACYDNCAGIDGDGFHYEVIKVPAECTAEMMGISVLDDNYADSFFEGYEED